MFFLSPLWRGSEGPLSDLRCRCCSFRKINSWSLSQLCRAPLCCAALGWAKEFTAERLLLAGAAAAGRLSVSKHSLRCVATLRCVIGCLPDAPPAPRRCGNDTLSERSSAVNSRLLAAVRLRSTCTDIYGRHDNEMEGVEGWMTLSHGENLHLRSHSSILLNSDRQRFKLISFFFLTHCKTNRLTLRKNKREESKTQKKTRRKQLLAR